MSAFWSTEAQQKPRWEEKMAKRLHMHMGKQLGGCVVKSECQTVAALEACAGGKRGVILTQSGISVASFPVGLKRVVQLQSPESHAKG